MEAENLLPVPSIDIEAESKITFNLYVNLPLNNKYVLYRRAGSEVEADKMEKLASLNVSNFFIEKKDYEEFVKYVSQRLCSLLSQPESADYSRQISSTARALLSSTFSQNDPAIATLMMSNLNEITQVIIENTLDSSEVAAKKLFQKMAELGEQGTNFQKHPVNVASLAVLLTFGIGYSRPQILKDVAMASLLHDIGLSKVPTNVAVHAHEPLKLDIKERQWLYKHPLLSIEILEEKKIVISPAMKMMILQHHEEYNGSGFPFALRGFMINELSQVLRVADELDHLFQDLQTNPSPLRLRVAELLRRFSDQKVIEPLLLARIRRVLV